MTVISRSTIVIVVFLNTGFTTARAQLDLSKWQIGANVGMFIYQGDLTPSPIGSYRTTQPGLGIYISRVLNPSFIVRANFAMANLHGNDALYTSPAWRKERNFSFSSSAKEISAQLVWNIFSNNGNELDKRISPYAFAGAGVTILKGVRYYGSMTKEFIAAEPQAVKGLVFDLAHPQSKLIAVVPVGAGIEYYLSPRISLTAETCFRFTFTDYIDGFSKAANSNKKDYYHAHTVGVVYKFGKKDKYGCPKM